MQTISSAVELARGEALGPRHELPISTNDTIETMPDTRSRDASRTSPVRPTAVLPADLDPFDRMLLTTDGTVTTLLEACAGEPITTRTTRQTGPATLDSLRAATGWWWQPDAGLLELAPAEQLIARRAILRGARSGVAYVLAESLVVPHRLPDLMADRLMRAGGSLGRLLAAASVETRREILQITTMRAGPASDHLGVPPDAPLACRTYRIVTNQRAAAVITELLPPRRLAATALGGFGPRDWSSYPPTTPWST